MKSDSNIVLELKGLTLRRNGISILENVSWKVLAGEHWVILGANGSGKTSLLSALTGYFMPTGGGITVFGREYGKSDWRELRKHIGIVSSSIRQMMSDQETALESVVSGRYAMIDYWGKVSRTDRIHALKLLKETECEALENRPWAVLSQGERQRILIARALMASPKLLILDEPCAGLDPAAREHFLDFLERLARSKGSPSLVLVTHHVEEIVPVFSHALVLQSGQSIACGKIGDSLSGKILGRAFDATCRISKNKGRYSLRVQSLRRRIA